MSLIVSLGKVTSIGFIPLGMGTTGSIETSSLQILLALILGLGCGVYRCLQKLSSSSGLCCTTASLLERCFPIVVLSTITCIRGVISMLKPRCTVCMTVALSKTYGNQSSFLSITFSRVIIFTVAAELDS
jgi:hypothetical protein